MLHIVRLKDARDRDPLSEGEREDELDRLRAANIALRMRLQEISRSRFFQNFGDVIPCLLCLTEVPVGEICSQCEQ